MSLNRLIHCLFLIVFSISFAFNIQDGNFALAFVAGVVMVIDVIIIMNDKGVRH